jgi:hypothetical protein
MRTRLTDVVVQRLQTPGTYLDETTPGFGLRVGKNRKTWIIMRGQVRQRLRIPHPTFWRLLPARGPGANAGAISCFPPYLETLPKLSLL